MTIVGVATHRFGAGARLRDRDPSEPKRWHVGRAGRVDHLFGCRREAANGIEIRRNLAEAGCFGMAVVPRVHEALCTKRMLVMEEIYPATPLTQVCHTHTHTHTVCHTHTHCVWSRPQRRGQRNG